MFFKLNNSELGLRKSISEISAKSGNELLRSISHAERPDPAKGKDSFIKDLVLNQIIGSVFTSLNPQNEARPHGVEAIVNLIREILTSNKSTSALSDPVAKFQQTLDEANKSSVPKVYGGMGSCN